jgi:hypothetical protein
MISVIYKINTNEQLSSYRVNNFYTLACVVD